MIRATDRLRELERSQAREHGARTYSEALAIFSALWREAVRLNPDFPGDWRDDLVPDIAVGRAVNGLPPDA